MTKHSLNKLDARTASNLKTPGRHTDGGGLYLSIDKSGRRRWVFMYVKNGKRTELGLGGGRDLTLAKARHGAAELRAIIHEGGDPKLKRSAPAHSTFGECADDYVETHRSSWRNAKHAAQWEMTLTVHAQAIRHIRVDLVNTEDVLRVLKPLWAETPETAKRLRGRIENVLDAANAKGLRSGENPARWRGHLDQLLPKQQRLSRGHHAALPYNDLPKFMVDLRTRDAMAGLALEFAILTAARSGEVINATWGEFDLEAAVWTIPANRMKAGKEHRVPISKRALEILSILAPDGDKKPKSEDYVFKSNKPHKPISSMAMAMLLRRMKVDVTVHGFRSTFRDWASETTSFSSETCEHALAHQIKDKAEAAYRRGDQLEKRRELMKEWAMYCGPEN
mgnify:CR=1 FL=1